MFSSNLNLLKQLVKRDVLAKYKGSSLGILWSVVIPIMLLAIYTFVFSVVFEARWNVQSNNHLQFALIIFSGMTIFNFFSEVINRSPTLIIGNSNYVKKVIFPLHLLPVSIVLSSIVHMLISFIILFIGLAFFGGGIHITALYLPLVCLPIILFATGLSWFLASLGTYVRDVSYVVNVLTSALMFLSPIFYPVSSVPKELRFLYNLNPISFTVEDMRNVLIWGVRPDFVWLGYGTLIGIVFCLLGYYWFKKTKGGFADVL
ncbi:sugar ABC transporter permease [Paenibacillus sp. FSL H7-0357]|uniref:ABC transporter permease n=1 Tax=Paenibacillus sp. FSL H7-0357 TaxID=1536774 RepID=UPI0004F81737|nr:ABC transporter permease [Paenibacillus sp. FSL H7-0357]AIQ20840.1 sugar ABC transporter permease [Paenibacillus sp. FSL H7-0357]